MTTLRSLNHQDAFQQAWIDPKNTRFELPPVDVNRVLAEHYGISKPLRFTRSMLWDMEVRKAWRPDQYIPSVIKPGSVQSWGHVAAADGTESFVRVSEQRLWLEPATYGLVIEQVHLNPPQQQVTFIGATQGSDRHGELLRAGVGQPLFHVEHSVDGDELRPLNKWRIVHLTDRPDRRLIDCFKRKATDLWLPEFIEIYIERVLNIKLTKKI